MPRSLSQTLAFTELAALRGHNSYNMRIIVRMVRQHDGESFVCGRNLPWQKR
ncbi:hypothetical protein ACFPME_00750 [Rhodanobacter umsongensis]|uniref:Uncharacterized protein n=1 Tax=Rhodanobacter umsongensis TaxID=633153 RepID=A0ABW0JGW9_9GAMM